MFHRVFSPPPCLYSIDCVLSPPRTGGFYVPPCLGFILYVPPRLCFIVSLLHYVYAPPMTAEFYVPSCLFSPPVYFPWLELGVDTVDSG